jgi:hypothetical protein
MQFYINLDNEVFGPFSQSELMNDYGKYLTKDILITTDTLNGEWYEAKCFECFDDLFETQQEFSINPFGEIIRHDTYDYPRDDFNDQENDELSIGLSWLSFCIPLAGAIIYFSNKDNKPEKAKKACHLALWGMLVGFILNLISYAIQ